MLLPRLMVGLLLSAGALCAPAAVAAVPNPHPDLIEVWQPCEPGVGVTIVVDRQDRLGDGRIDVRCAPGPQPNGWVALQNAGFDVEGLAGGVGFVCRIDGLPTPEDEPCVLTPGGDEYWSYWHGRPGGRWAYSGIGATSPLSAAGVDAVQGWSFGAGPRIEPMNGAGPSAFLLPAAQASSAAPKALAHDWLAEVVAETGRLAQVGELAPETDITWGSGLLELLALREAGADAATVAPFAEWLTSSDGRVGLQWASTASMANPPIDPADPDHWSYWNLDRLPLVALGLEAAGHDPTGFVGHDLRAYMLQAVDPATGKLRSHTPPGSIFRQLAGEWVVDGEGPFGAFFPQSAFAYAGLLRAFLHTGGLPAEATATVGHFLAKQDPVTGSFGGSPEGELWALWALVELRRAGVAGLEEPLERSADFLATLQEDDGGVRQRSEADALYDPNVQSTAFGAAGLALAGRQAAAEKAAKWVSRYQVTAEYAGVPAPGSDDLPPAFDAIGAFLPNEGALRDALAFGVSSNEYGLFNEARLPTAAALLAFAFAGPYGPYGATVDRQSLWFDSQTVGSAGGSKTATLTNADERAITVAGAYPAGEQAGDFAVDAADCAGRTLAAGESCEVSATFTPTKPGTRQAIVHLPLAGTTQTLVVSLGGTAVAAPDPDPDADTDADPDPGPTPGPGHGEDPGPVVDPPAGPASILDAAPPASPRSTSAAGRRPAIVALRRTQTVDRRRRVALARLSCPSGPACRVFAARRAWLTIGGERHRLTVSAPSVVAGGGSALVRARLPVAAVDRLAGRATLTLRVVLARPGERTRRTISMTITG